jgi:hypothetical protein
MTTKMLKVLAVLCATLALPAAAHAVPALQVYVQGATYNSTSATWVLNTDQTGGTVVITATTQNGNSAENDIYNAQMVVSALQDTSFGASLTGGDNNLSLSGLSSAGNSPLLTGGDANNAVSYISFGIGDFTGTADKTTDNVSGGGGHSSGNIQTFTLTLTNLTGSVIIDAYGYNATGGLVVAPYSHNGEITLASVPELSGHGAGSAAVLIVGVGLFFSARRRRR